MKVVSTCLATFLLICGCGGSSSQQVGCGRDPGTGFERCYQNNNYGEAAVAAGVGAAVWGVTGCEVNGCRPPYVCNRKTKQCELSSCENDMSCPAGFCDLSTKRCK